MCKIIIERWWSCYAGHLQHSGLNQLLTSDRFLSTCETRQVEGKESVSSFQRLCIWTEQREWSPHQEDVERLVERLLGYGTWWSFGLASGGKN